MGSLTITVLQPAIAPTNFITCIGVTNTFTATDTTLSGAFSWSPAGAVSADTLVNKVAFTTAGTNWVFLSHRGCGVAVSGLVLAAGPLWADPLHLCRGGTVLYTAQTDQIGRAHV